MKILKDILREVGFSNELIDAINATPQLEGQENNVDNTYYQAYENDITSSTEINISDNPHMYNYYGDEVE